MTDISLEDLATLAIGSARGRKSKTVSMSVVRELNPGDLDLILNPPPKGIVATPLARLRHSHHQLARLLAEGTKPGECSMITGYSPSRVSILQQDPAFQELVEYYRQNVEAKYLDVHERLAALGFSSLDELQERLEADPESFKTRELLELAEFALDRSVTKDTRKGGGGVVVPPVVVTFVGTPAREAPPVQLDSRPVIEGETEDGT